ncbi:MAG: thiosulfate oxidation carrier complex protein SoxZ [Rhodospirillales bacterium]|nr:thiosulfate oxidation carrier complex protein SoxZ [Rhodospirillales bacterium]
MTARVIITAPTKAKKGEIVTVTTLLAHVMENGFRHSSTGVPIPRDIVTEFVARYNGAEILRASLYPAIAANPYFAFEFVAEESGILDFSWMGDNGFAASRQIAINVE